MKFNVVNSNDFFNKDTNPTFCMSAQRGCNSCQDCDKYITYSRKNKEKTPTEIIAEMPCKPLVEDLGVLEQIHEKETRIRRIRDEINNLRKK